MFAEITLHDFRKPLTERAKSRKVCGPYRWTPAKAGILEPGGAFEVCYNGGAVLACKLENEAPTLGDALGLIALDKQLRDLLGKDA